MRGQIESFHPHVQITNCSAYAHQSFTGSYSPWDNQAIQSCGVFEPGVEEQRTQRPSGTTDEHAAAANISGSSLHQHIALLGQLQEIGWHLVHEISKDLRTITLQLFDAAGEPHMYIIHML